MDAVAPVTGIAVLTTATHTTALGAAAMAVILAMVGLHCHSTDAE